MPRVSRRGADRQPGTQRDWSGFGAEGTRLRMVVAVRHYQKYRSAAPAAIIVAYVD